MKLKPLLLTSGNFYSRGNLIMCPQLQSETKQMRHELYVSDWMHFNPRQPSAQTYVPSLSWVLCFPAAPEVNGASNHVKNLPSLSRALWDSWIFLHRTYIFFFQKWDDDERDTSVAMGTQREVCVSRAPSCKQVLLALEMGVSALMASVQVLPTWSPRVPGSGSGGPAPFMLREEDLKGQVTVK